MSAARTIGFIGDIHGDQRALQWALDVTQHVDLRVSMGDVVDGWDDERCIALLRYQKILVIQGNHDAWAASGSLVSQVYSDDIRRWLADLPLSYTEAEWLACHSRHTSWGGERFWTYLTDSDEVRQAFRELSQRVIFCGHTHVPAVHVLHQDDLSLIPGRALVRDPRRTLETASRYLVHVGRPTQCVAIYDRAAGVLEYVFQPSPRFERRFTHMLEEP